MVTKRLSFLFLGLLLAWSFLGDWTSGPERVASAAPAAPILNSPPNGKTLTNFEPNLTWTNPAGTTQVHLQIIPFNLDGPGVNLYLGTPVTSYQIPPPPQWYGLLPDITYTWQVRVSNVAAFVGEDDPSWSPWVQATFRTPVVTSATITAVSPANGDLIQTYAITLRWANTHPNVFYYEVQASPDPNFGEQGAVASVWHNLLHGGVTNPSNSWLTPQLQRGATYYWRVRPRVQGDGAPVAWSASFSFQVGPSPAPPITFTVPDPLPQATVGVWYEFLFCTPHSGGATEQCPSPGQAPVNPAGGNPPYHFEKEPGSQFWPFGLSLGKDGQLTGRPEAPDIKQFTVCAIDLSGNQACAKTTLKVVSPPPPAPVGVAASDGTYSDRIVISWIAVAGAERYWIYRNNANDTSTAQELGWVSAVYTSAYDPNVVPGQVYWYWVRAENTGGTRSPYSNGDSGYAQALAALSFAITSATCRDSGLPPRVGWSYRYEVTARGTASGPEGTQLNITTEQHRIQYVSGEVFSSSWGDGRSPLVTRGPGQPANTEWTARFYVDGLSDWYVVYGGNVSHPDHPSSTVSETRRITCTR